MIYFGYEDCGERGRGQRATLYCPTTVKCNIVNRNYDYINANNVSFMNISVGF